VLRGSESAYLQKGLNKLQEANELVNELTKNAQVQKAELKVKQAEADEALAGIQKAM